jgi:hypothetical protein
MRAIVIAAAVLGCLCGPSSAYDFETKKGQAVCDTLAEFEELSIAIGMQDDRYIEEMGNKGCHFPEPGVGMTLLEAYADQTVLLFRRLADNTRLGPVPEHIDRFTNLAKVRLFHSDRDPTVGFTLLPLSHRPDGRGGLQGGLRIEPDDAN